MATKAKAAKGTKLQIGDGGGSEVFTTIAEVRSVSGPEESVSEIDVSNMDSLAEEFIAGLPSAGEVSFEFNFVGSSPQQQQLRSDMRNGVQRNFKYILPDHATTPTTFSFAAIITALSLNAPDAKSEHRGSCTLRVSGVATVAYAPA